MVSRRARIGAVAFCAVALAIVAWVVAPLIVRPTLAKLEHWTDMTYARPALVPSEPTDEHALDDIIKWQARDIDRQLKYAR